MAFPVGRTLDDHVVDGNITDWRTYAEPSKVGSDWIANSRHGGGVVSLLNKSFDRHGDPTQLGHDSASGSEDGDNNNDDDVDDEWTDPDDDAPSIDGGGGGVEDAGGVAFREAEGRGASLAAAAETPFSAGHADVRSTLWHRQATEGRFERGKHRVLRSPGDVCGRSVHESCRYS
jgi:hypothetical protein